MRFDKTLTILTLEQDIRQIWKEHGWDVIQISVDKEGWHIKAEWVGAEQV